MDLHVEAHRPTPIRRPGAEPLTDVLEGSGFPRGPARRSIRELAGFFGIQLNPIVRAGAPPGPARHAGDGMRGVIAPVKEDLA
jgi:hypothetical protein